MIKLRTVLLSNYPYIIILIFVSLISIFRINQKKVSNYTEKSTTLTGFIEEYNIDGNKLTLTVKNNERIIGNYYIKTEKEKKDLEENLKLGILIKCKASFSLPEDKTNDFGFSYKDYLYREDIFYTVKITDYKIIDNNESLYYKMKNNIYDNIKNLKSEKYLRTFLLGDKSLLDEKIVDGYRTLGISHLFAISGMHITFLSGLLLSILKKLKVEENKRYYITISFLLFYLFLLGLSPSVLRAVIFFLLFSINNIYYFYIKPVNIFILTLSISLIINPYYIFDVGFLYSFSISFSLIFFSNLLNKPKHYLTKLLTTSLISFLVSIPISLYNFYQINILSIIYNLFYVPLITIIVFPLALLTFIFKPLDSLYIIFINFLEKSTLYLKNINIGILTFPKLNILYYILLFIFIILVIYYRKKILYFVLLIILTVHYFYMDITNPSFMTVLDVGQGDSTLFVSNKKAMLVDTGGVMSFDKYKWQQKKNTQSIVKTRTIPYLKALGIKKLDYLVLTHGDYDHLGEALTLLENFKVDHVFINEGNLNYLERKINKKHKVIILTQDSTFTLGDFYIYSLNKDLKEENDSSIVLYIKYNDIYILMMADATIRSEKEILNTYNLHKVDIIKIGHHGSKTSSSKKFLKKINPNLALISAGKDNKFKHPHKVITNRLDKLSIPYLVTSKTGSIKIDMKTKEVTTTRSIK